MGPHENNDLKAVETHESSVKTSDIPEEVVKIAPAECGSGSLRLGLEPPRHKLRLVNFGTRISLKMIYVKICEHQMSPENITKCM